MSTNAVERSDRWLLRRGAIFCLLGLIIAFSADGLLWAGLRRARASNFAVWNAVVAGRIGSDVLITGGSRALVGVDCEILGRRLSMSCFNIGLDGSPVNLQRPYVETYLQHNKPPRLAVVNLDMGSLTESTKPYDLAQYLSYLDEQPIAAGLRRYVDVWKYRYIPLYAFSQLGLNQVMVAVRGATGHSDPASDRPRVQGFRPMDLEWDQSFNEFSAENPGGTAFPIDDVGIAELERMISLLESRGAWVVLVFSPEWEGVRRFELNRDAVMRTFADIAARHHISFIDYTWSAIGQDKSLFYNSQHLNRKGASLFTALLGDDLARLPPLSLTRLVD